MMGVGRVRAYVTHRARRRPIQTLTPLSLPPSNSPSLCTQPTNPQHPKRCRRSTPSTRHTSSSWGRTRRRGSRTTSCRWVLFFCTAGKAGRGGGRCFFWWGVLLYVERHRRGDISCRWVGGFVHVGVLGGWGGRRWSWLGGRVLLCGEG